MLPITISRKYFSSSTYLFCLLSDTMQYYSYTFHTSIPIVCCSDHITYKGVRPT